MTESNKFIGGLTYPEFRLHAIFAPDALYHTMLMGGFPKFEKQINNIQTKAMTEAQFEEEEHPRSSDGKFTDKPGGTTAAASKQDGSGLGKSQGGARRNAGRTPKDAIAANLKLKQRFQDEVPGASEEEINKKITEWALKKGNTDLYLYKTDPVEFQKRRDQQRMDALISHGTKQKVNGKDIERVDDSPGTASTRSDLKTSEAAWKRMVQQSKDVGEAYRTFKDSDQAEEADKSKAKLVTAAASIAAVVGLGVLYAKRPKATIATYRAVGKDNLTWIRWFKAQGLDKDIGEAAEHIKLQEGVIDERKVGAIRNMMGRIAEKFGKVDPKTGERLYPFLGPKATGFGSKTRYAPRDFDVIKNAENYVPTNGDMDAKTGLWLVRGEAKDLKVNYKAIAFAHERVPMDPAKWGKGKWAKVIRDKDGKPKPPPGLRIKTRTDGTKEWDFEKEGEGQFQAWLSQNQKRYPSPEPIINPKTEMPYDSKWPSRIMRPRDLDKYNADIAAAEEYRGYLHYFDFKVLPRVSGRVLAMLTAAAGTTGVGGTAYYFQGDIENWLSSYTKHQQESEEATAKIQAPRKGSDTSDLKRIRALTAYEKQKEKTNKAGEHRAYQQDVLAKTRIEFTKALTNMMLRRHTEGSVPNWAMDTKTLFRRFDDVGISDSTDKLNKAREIMLGDNLALQKEFLDEVAAMPFRTETAQRQWANWEETGSFTKTKKSAKKPSPDAGVGAADDNIRGKAETIKTQGISGLGLIMKMFDAESKEAKPTKVATEDDIITAMAAEIAKMIVDISQSCKSAIKSGMPGNSEFAELNDIVGEIVGYLKDLASKNNPEKVETKALDMAGVMSSQVDAQGGLFAEPIRCKRCGQVVTKELMATCKRSECPISYLEKVVEKTKEAKV